MPKPRRAKRFTVGQKAAIHGLLLAGVKFQRACEVAGVCRKSALRYVAADWRKKHRGSPSERLAAIRLAYFDRAVPLKVAGARVGLTERGIRYYARREGWHRQKRSPKPPVGASASTDAIPQGGRAARPAVVSPPAAGRAL